MSQELEIGFDNSFEKSYGIISKIRLNLKLNYSHFISQQNFKINLSKLSIQLK